MLNPPKLKKVFETFSRSSRYLFNKDSSKLFTTHICTLSIWDVNTGQLLKRFELNTPSNKSSSGDKVIYSISLNPDETQILCGYQNAKAEIFDLETGASIKVMPGYVAGSQASAWSPNGNQVAVRAGSQGAYIVNPTTGSIIHQLTSHSQTINHLVFSPDGMKIATTAMSSDHTVMIWDTDTGQRIRTINLGATPRAIAWSEDGQQLYTSDNTNGGQIWDVNTGDSLKTFRAFTSYLENGTIVSSSGRIIDIETEEDLATFEIYNATLSVNSDKTMIACANQSDRIAIYSTDLSLAEEQIMPEEPINLGWIEKQYIPSINDICTSEDGFIAVGSNGLITTIKSEDESVFVQSIGSMKLNSVCNHENVFVAVGEAGTIATNRIKNIWSVQKIGDADFSKVFFGDQWVAIGKEGTIATSIDAENWIIQKIGEADYHDLYYSDGRWVVVGSLGTISTSVDGKTWTMQQVGNANYLPSMSYNTVRCGNGTWVVIGNHSDGRGTRIYSFDGESWTIDIANHSLEFYDLEYYSNAWVCSIRGALHISGDGVNWTSESVNSTDYTTVYCSNGTWILSGMRLASTAIRSTSNPLYDIPNQTWTVFSIPREADSNIRYPRVAHSKGKTIIANDTTILISSNLKNLSVLYKPGEVRDIFKYQDKTIVLNSAGGTTTIDDGVYDIQKEYGTALVNIQSTYVDYITNVWPSESQIVGVGYRGLVGFSTDGKKWTLKRQGDATYNDIYYSGNRYVAVGASGTIATSLDGRSWTVKNVGSAAYNSIHFFNNRWVAVGASGIISTSTDGENWTTKNIGNQSYYYISYDNEQWIAFGEFGNMAISSDGENWDLKIHYEHLRFYDIGYYDGRWVLAGNSGNILTSVDCENWTSHKVGSNDYTSVFHDGTKWILLGKNGMTTTSLDGENWTTQLIDNIDYIGARSINGRLYYLSTNKILVQFPEDLIEESSPFLDDPELIYNELDLPLVTSGINNSLQIPVEKGFIISTSESFEIDDPQTVKIISEDPTSSFSAKVNGLPSGQYFIRPYAIMPSTVIYGEPLEFQFTSSSNDDQIHFMKVLELPEEWQPNTLYFIQNSDTAETYVTSNSGIPVRVGNSSMINDLIEENVSKISQAVWKNTDW